MRLALVYARIQVLELLRFPGFSIATLGFPTLLFALFGLPRAHDEPNVLVASYAAFAVLGVGFYQFGVSAAMERTTPWAAAFLRTLPASPSTRLAGRVLAALTFAVAATSALFVFAVLTTPVSLGAGRWIALCATLLVGSIPFVALGVGIAYWTTPKTALPVANVLYLVLAYLGALWTGPRDLPAGVRTISTYTPTRQWANALWGAIAGDPLRPTPWLVLAAYLIVFALVATVGYRRDEGQRFR
ncbi:MAG TPA: ABC transporter permease [Gaiellaceae bacterium]|nr:ABC transporter permease [Gaiellaceae bacterium]